MPSEAPSSSRRVLSLRIILGTMALLLLAGVFVFDSPWKVGIEKLTEPDTGAKLGDFINAGEWTACLINGILCAVLAATVPWWIGAVSPIAPKTGPWWKRVLSSRLLWLMGIVAFGAFFVPAMLPRGEGTNPPGFYWGPPYADARASFLETLSHWTTWTWDPQSNFWIFTLSGLIILAGAVSWLVLPLGRLDGGRDEPATSRALAPPRSWVPLFYLLLLVIVGIAGWIRAPRLDHSLWNDEEYSLRRYVWGYQKVRPDDTLKPDRVKWDETFFFNRGANNHIPHSVTSRLSLEAWSRAFQKPGDERFFSERAYRIPVYLAGLLGICVLAILLAEMGLAPVGLTAAVLLTLHPWHIRYSVEARGYSWMLLFMVLALLCLHRALRRSEGDQPGNQWRSWLGYGLCQFLYMWSFPGAIYVAAVLNAAVLGWLAWEHRAKMRRPLETPFPRFVIANVASAMLFVQAMAPSIPQIRLYLQRDISEGVMNADWWRDIAAHVLTGIQWSQGPGIVRYAGMGVERLELSEHWQTAPWLGGIAVVLIITLALGLVVLISRLLRRRRPDILLILAPVLAAVLAYIHTQLSGNFLFSWYIIYAVPGLCVLVAAGVAIVFLKGDTQPARAVAAIGACIVMASFAVLNSKISGSVRMIPRQRLDIVSFENRTKAHYTPSLGLYRKVYSFTGPVRPEMKSVLGIGPAPDQWGSVAVFGVSAEQFRSYEPRIHVLKSAKDLQDFLCQASKRGDWPMVYVSGPSRAATEDKELSDALKSYLEKIGRYSMGQTLTPEAMFDVYAYQIKPSPIMCEPPAPTP